MTNLLEAIMTSNFKPSRRQLFSAAGALGLAAAGASSAHAAAPAAKPGVKLAWRDLRQDEVLAYKGNPWGLVYEGALTKNEPGKVNIHPVTYKLHGIDIAANIYTPAGYDASKKYPAIVVAHPNGGVKEQVSGLFAQLLAGMGYITIAPDAAYQGASGGYPRLVDRPMNRIEDLHGAADMISQYPGVDADRLGIFGICGGGGYTLAAGQTDKRFKAVATLSAFNTGLVRKNGFLDSQMNTLAERLQAAAKARALEAATGEVLYTPNMIDEKSGATEEVVKKLPFPLYRDGWYYYGKTHRHPNSSFAMTQSSLLDLVLFDASAGMGMIDQPLLMMAGDIADTFYLTEGCYVKATGTKNKELFLIRGAQHIETYWKPEFVEQEASKLKEFFGKYL